VSGQVGSFDSTTITFVTHEKNLQNLQPEIQMVTETEQSGSLSEMKFNGGIRFGSRAAGAFQCT